MEPVHGITIGVRDTDASLHIRTVKLAATRCRFLYEEYRRHRTDEALTELRNQCVATVMMCAAALSACTNASDNNDVEDLLREFLVPDLLQ